MQLQSPTFQQLITLAEPFFNYGVSLFFENEINPYIYGLKLIFGNSIDPILNTFFVKHILKFFFDSGLLPILILRLSQFNIFLFDLKLILNYLITNSKDLALTFVYAFIKEFAKLLSHYCMILFFLIFKIVYATFKYFFLLTKYVLTYFISLR